MLMRRSLVGKTLVDRRSSEERGSPESRPRTRRDRGETVSEEGEGIPGGLHRMRGLEIEGNSFKRKVKLTDHCESLSILFPPTCFDMMPCQYKKNFGI
jgi:hypothetical protein